MLDERGQDIGSEEMAELVGDAGNAVRTSYKWSLPFLMHDHLSIECAYWHYTERAQVFYHVTDPWHVV